MKNNKNFNPLAWSMLALSVSSLAFSAAYASQYSNSYPEDESGSRIVRVEYTGLSKSMGFFDETNPPARPAYAGEADTRLQRRKQILQPVEVRPGGKTYRDGSIFGGTCCEATKEQDNSMVPGLGCGSHGKSCDRVVPVKPAPCVPAKACPKSRKPVDVETPDSIRYNFVQNYVTRPRRDVYTSIHQRCNKYAPIQLEWVDFRLNEEDINGTLAQKLGNYRFRIFGCRRFTKEAFLNQGRLMEKNIRLISVFDNEMKDCFKITKIPNDLCTEVTPSPLPEYLITAEITNYFMNICDKYNWDENIREERRIGSSEITVRWIITDINHTKIYWSGETDGYGELNRGEPNGEILLVEKAFADAVNNLRNHPGFLRQVSRRFSPSERENQRIQLIDYERANNPVKCQYTRHEAEANQVSKYVYTPEKTTVTTTTTTTIERTPAQPAPVEQPRSPVIIREPQATVTERIPAPKVVAKMPDGAVVTKHTDGTVTTTVTTTTTPPAPVPQTSETSTIKTTVTTTTDISGTNSTGTEEIILDSLPVEIPAPIPAPLPPVPEPEPVASAQPADILLSKEPAPEPFDPSLNPQSPEKRYGNIEETAEVKVDLTTTDLENPAGILPGAECPIAQPKPCNNMTLFGPDCDCDNKIYRGCEDNKLDWKCEDNRLFGCDKCGGLFSSCGVEEEPVKACKLPLDVVEDGGVRALGTSSAGDTAGTVSKETWISVPVENKGAIEAQNTLCIIDRPPYQAPLSPEDIYKIRASVISITNHNGKEGAGLIVSEQFVLTSADLISKEYNSYDLRTINGGRFTGQAVRINPDKNTALIFMDKPTTYTPLSLNLSLPPISGETYLTLGILDFDTGEGYLEDSGKVSGYRYSESRGTEILVDTYVQNITLGGALINKFGTIAGFAHSGSNGSENTDLFLPITTALKSVGLEICGKQLTDIPIRNTEISEAILFNNGSKEPLPMDKAERK